MEVRAFCLVLLLVMCSALLAEAQTWDDFKSKHIYGSMTENACSRVMNQKKPEGNGPFSNSCKERNTFIRATDGLVKPVCTGAGTAVGRGNREGEIIYESNQVFSVVTCTGNRNQRYPRCEYRGRRDTRKITITCNNNGLPLHYNEDTLVIG
ncbi:ribonuclease-like 3 precursor [Silurus meridionalis]|uniref:Ribonuclease A-domain domain-containing protein n=1 Tax=Silurus meridionalis TaxID=175797 RepID=A0A8T0ACN2_SILME|nr:hypothetical protein HF521_013724 [Silurus meridionalis]KAI5089549.1 ribonuclease-like 3 precursor [Silurus meridionalis]